MCDYQGILQHFTKYSVTQLEDIADGRIKIVLPSLSIPQISMILKESENLFKNEPSMLTLNTLPITIVGDLHGHLLDLLRIIQVQGLPSDSNQYLFLGDIVDRGEFSLETVLIILLLKIIYPSNVYVIRGNHEFRQMCQQFGFFAEVNECYPGTDIFSDFMTTFSYIPIVALISEKYICVHGGIGPNVFSLLQFQNIQRPITEFNDPIATSLLWSDPSETVLDFMPSKRGGGYVFGKTQLEAFLNDTNTKVLIRAHECVAYGIEKMFGGKLITVFSASNYCGNSANNGAILRIVKNGIMDSSQFQPFHYLKRSSALFMQMFSSSQKKNLQTAKSLFDMSSPHNGQKGMCPGIVPLVNVKNKLNLNQALKRQSLNAKPSIFDHISSDGAMSNTTNASTPPIADSILGGNRFACETISEEGDPVAPIIKPMPRPKKKILKSESQAFHYYAPALGKRQSLPLKSLAET